MKLYYISTRDIRKNRADCVHVMRSCHEFVKNGFLVNLVTPRTFRSEYKKSKEEIWRLYNLPKDFIITELPTVLFDNMPKIISPIIVIQKFFLFLLFYLKKIISRKFSDGSVIYSICYASLLPALFLRKIGLIKAKVIFEKSDIKTKWIQRYTAANLNGMVAINEFIKTKAIENYDFDENKIMRRDFPSMFEDVNSIQEVNIENARRLLSYDLQDKIVVYAGKISPYLPEIHYILKSAKKLPDVKFVLIGLREKFEMFFKNYLKINNLKNIQFLPFQPVKNFIMHIKIADILVSYYDSFDYYSVTQRVPAKSSIYLVAEKPIIFADLPSLREWFDDSMVYFVKPDNPDLLAKKIQYILSNPYEAKIKAHKCYLFAKNHTYSKAYSEISNFINRIKS